MADGGILMREGLVSYWAQAMIEMLRMAQDYELGRSGTRQRGVR